MSYGNYGSGRYTSSSYTPYGSGSRRSAGSSYIPSSSYNRRSSGGLLTSKSSSYLSPNCSPRSSVSSGMTYSYNPTSTRSSKSYESPSYGQSKSLHKALSAESDKRSSDFSGYKLATSRSTGSIGSDLSDSSQSLGATERMRIRYGSNFPDTASDISSKSDVSSRYSSKSSLCDDSDKDYKKLYEDIKKENERLKEVEKEATRLRETLKKTEEELEKTKKLLKKMTETNNSRNSVGEIEKKERRALERKLSEMEEEVKQIDILKAQNEKLHNENGSLIRVLNKVSKNRHL